MDFQFSPMTMALMDQNRTYRLGERPSMGESIQRAQLNNAKMQEVERQNAAREAIANIDWDDPDAYKKLLRIDPDLAIKMQQQQRLKKQQESYDRMLGGASGGILDMSEDDLVGLVGHPTLGASAKAQLERLGNQNAPTKGQEALDKAYGKEYAEYVAGGGESSTQKNLEQLQDARDMLANRGETSVTGREFAFIPDALEPIIAPKATAIKERVEEVVQRNLREVLGAQFTEKEGERLISRAYNPKLSEEENLRRLDLLIKQIRAGYEAKADSARYFEKNGTLMGWQGKTPSFSDFEAAFDAPKQQQSSDQVIDWNDLPE